MRRIQNAYLEQLYAAPGAFKRIECNTCHTSMNV